MSRSSRSPVMIPILMAVLLAGPMAAGGEVPPCAANEAVADVRVDGYLAFVDSMHPIAGAKPWPRERIDAVAASYADAVENGYAGADGFGSLEAWASAFGLSRAPAGCPGPNCCGAGGALRMVYVPDAIQTAAWYELADGRRIATIQTGCGESRCALDGVYHELAHIWDLRWHGALGAQLDTAMEVARDRAGRVDLDVYYGRKIPGGESAEPAAARAEGSTRAPATHDSYRAPVQVHGDFPTAYFNRMHPSLPAGVEHFAETVMAYFLIEQGARYGFAACWSDEDLRCGSGRSYDYDRGDFVRNLINSTKQLSGGLRPHES